MSRTVPPPKAVAMATRNVPMGSRRRARASIKPEMAYARIPIASMTARARVRRGCILVCAFVLLRSLCSGFVRSGFGLVCWCARLQQDEDGACATIVRSGLAEGYHFFLLYEPRANFAF